MLLDNDQHSNHKVLNRRNQKNQEDANFNVKTKLFDTNVDISVPLAQHITQGNF